VLAGVRSIDLAETLAANFSNKTSILPKQQQDILGFHQSGI
jgi:hypothetical protein